MTGKPPDHLPAPGSVEELEELLSRPPDSVVAAMAALDGDLAFLGVAGKMGPTMARMARCGDRSGGREQAGIRRVAISRLGCARTIGELGDPNHRL